MMKTGKGVACIPMDTGNEDNVVYGVAFLFTKQNDITGHCIRIQIPL